MATMTIGEVAHRAGLTPPTLRYYERLGLIAPPPRVSGQRRYSGDVLVTLRLIHMAQAAGFSLAEIDTLLHGFGTTTPPGARWQGLAQRKIPEVDAMIRRLRTVRRLLEESLHCDCLTLAACADTGWSAAS